MQQRGSGGVIAVAQSCDRGGDCTIVGLASIKS
jgi:hypothetical protein